MDPHLLPSPAAWRTSEWPWCPGQCDRPQPLAPPTNRHQGASVAGDISGWGQAHCGKAGRLNSFGGSRPSMGHSLSTPTLKDWEKAPVQGQIDTEQKFVLVPGPPKSCSISWTELRNRPETSGGIKGLLKRDRAFMQQEDIKYLPDELSDVQNMKFQSPLNTWPLKQTNKQNDLRHTRLSQ